MKKISVKQGVFTTFVTGCRRKHQERHQHLPLSMARLECSSFITDRCRWSVDGTGSVASATGQEIARTLSHVFWGKESATKTPREAKYRSILKEDIGKASTGVGKDALTYGLFSLTDNDPDLKAKVVAYADSARDDVFTVEGLPSQSAMYEYPNLHRKICLKFYLFPFTSNSSNCSSQNSTRAVEVQVCPSSTEYVPGSTGLVGQGL